MFCLNSSGWQQLRQSGERLWSRKSASVTPSLQGALWEVEAVGVVLVLVFALMTQTFSCVLELGGVSSCSSVNSADKSSCPIGCRCYDMGQPIRTLTGSVCLLVSERLFEPQSFQPGEQQQHSFNFTVGVAKSGRHPSCKICTLQYRLWLNDKWHLRQYCNITKFDLTTKAPIWFWFWSRDL